MITIAAAAALFSIGLIAGAIALLRAGIAREEHNRSLLDDPPSVAAAATRRIVGLYVRSPRQASAVDQIADTAETGRHS